MKHLLNIFLPLLLLLVMVTPTTLAMRMTREDQSVVTDQYGLMRMADKIVVKTPGEQVIKTIDSPDQLKAVNDFLYQHQFHWNQTGGPRSEYVLEFLLVKDSLIHLGLSRSSLTFRNNGESFRCSLKEYDAQELKRLLGLSGY